MEDLQFGDRFYYLSRTAGLNMLTQLEGNSFAELIHAQHGRRGPAGRLVLPAAFVFNLANLRHAPGPSSTTRRPRLERGGAAHPACRRHAPLRRPGSTSSSTAPPATTGVWSSEGDDTIRGNDGNDWMQGGDGNDNHIGGLGDDILLDTNGDDTLKGGDGNDTLSSGQGFGGDLNQGGRGNDFIVDGRHRRGVRRTR